MAPSIPTLRMERTLWQSGALRVVGVDECGMGSLCSAVVAAACLVPVNCRRIAGVRDSKTLSARQRERLASEIRRRTVIAVGAASVVEIDRINIYHASHLAMRRALRRIGEYDHVLVDGRRIAGFDDVGPHTAVIDGDALCYAIACASVVAKVTRDRLLAASRRAIPGTGWERNAGYSTASTSRRCAPSGYPAPPPQLRAVAVGRRRAGRARPRGRGGRRPARAQRRG